MWDNFIIPLPTPHCHLYYLVPTYLHIDVYYMNNCFLKSFHMQSTPNKKINSETTNERKPQAKSNQPKMWRASALCGAMPITAGYVVELG